MKLGIICFIAAIYGVIVICGTEFSVLHFTVNIKNMRAKKPFITSSIIVSFWVILCFSIILLRVYHRKNTKTLCWILMVNILSVSFGMACALTSVSFFLNVLDTIPEDISLQLGEQIVWTVQPPDLVHRENPQYIFIQENEASIENSKTCLEAVINRSHQFKLTFACYFFKKEDTTTVPPFSEYYRNDLFSMIPELNTTVLKSIFDQYKNYIFLLSNVTNEMQVRLGNEAQRTKQQIDEFYSGLLYLSSQFNLNIFDASLETISFIITNLQSLQFAAWGCLVSGPAFWFLSLFTMSILSCCHCL